MSIGRQRLYVSGVVQGVGFRPHVYTLAMRLGLTGFVGNDTAGVFVEVQGKVEGISRFEAELQSGPPPLARIEAVESFEVGVVEGDAGFLILESESSEVGHTSISPDIATCEACLAEMLDAGNRRYRYPFIKCTNCGPCFTIIKATPYDRPQTTMAGFRMCTACEAEYDSPWDRRFHAQPNACAACGPRLTYLDGDGELGELLTEEDALQAACGALARGEIVAIKGIGGFHLAVDAANEAAVVRLRERKHRWSKPLAVMVRDVEAAREFTAVSEDEARVLRGHARPIVLLRRLEDGETSFRLAGQIAPGTKEVGVMLPYSGLHTLLMQACGPLVMTSGNLSSAPILWRNEDALQGLKGIADGFLLHDREIHVPCDDSVVRVCGELESPMRRSRGYAPLPVRLSSSGASVLAVGAELKSTFCLTQQGHAFLSQHIGDMESYETLAAFERALGHFKAIFRTQPELVACDLHPGYLSSRWGREYASRNGLPLVEVQHHHAHLCSAMAEHGLDGNAAILGLVFDGTGYGTDGAIWGGEVLKGDYRGFERLMHLRYTPMPGGDASIRHPYRMALAHLWAAGVEWKRDLPCVADVADAELAILERQLRTNLLCLPTSSVGRLFDAVAALIGVRQSATYEAQAAIELEAVSATLEDAASYAVEILDGEMDARPIIRALVEDLRSGVSRDVLASRFQRTVVEMMVAVAERAREMTNIEVVALTGGVMQNAGVAMLAGTLLRQRGFQIIEQRVVPANDGGVALGQAAIAIAQRHRN